MSNFVIHYVFIVRVDKRAGRVITTFSFIALASKGQRPERRKPPETELVEMELV